MQHGRRAQRLHQMEAPKQRALNARVSRGNVGILNPKQIPDSSGGLSAIKDLRARREVLLEFLSITLSESEILLKDHL